MSGEGAYFPGTGDSLPYIQNTPNEAQWSGHQYLPERLIENIVVKNRYLPEDEIREEIAIVLQGIERGGFS